MDVKGYYYRDEDQAFLVSDEATKEINRALARGSEVDTGGKTLYPIFSNPTERMLRTGKTKIPAWVIRPDSTPTLRWYWQIQEHKRNHSKCKPIGDGLCGFKMVRYFEWNASTSKWELCPMVNHADSVQEKVLDSK